jgi:hypothetical protein
MSTVAKPWTLRIYASDARTIVRVSHHITRAAAFRALARFEARNGRHCNAIDRDGGAS